MVLSIAPEKITTFQKKILDWYQRNKRDLPWRYTRDPYKILISEIMSQQTQISRVIPKYQAWIDRFPTIQDLAKASVSEVLRYWSGLGYNRRALNLKKTAEIVVERYGGKFPQQEKELLSLPGIGEYTARALLCFAFDKQIAVVDTNVRKVILTQIFKNSQNNKSTDDKTIEQTAQKLLPKGKAYEWNQALMDYAGAVLKKEKIPIPKQSKFLGSHRYYRGQILKVLLQKKKVSFEKLGQLIKKEYTQSDEEWLRKLIVELRNEGFITFVDDIIIFVS
jgi:A/G-specific adenine glycosylase